MHSDENVDLDRSPALALRAAAFDRLGVSAAVLDSDGVVVDTNQAWRLFAHLNDGPGHTTGVGVNYLDVCDRASVDGSVASATVARGLRRILSGEAVQMDVEYPCPSPTEDRWYLLQASALSVRDGAGVVVFHVDVTARKQLTDRLVVIADHDALTGLPNRRAAVRHLDEQLGRARACDETVWVLYIDIDDFKMVNDTCGHHVGDELLVKVGMRARRALRDDDRLCRLGGDEFIVICQGLDRSTVLRVADRLRAAMNAPFQIGDLQVFGRISIGVAESDAASTAQSMLQAADAEMYIDKHGDSPSPGQDALLGSALPVRVASRQQTPAPRPHSHGRRGRDEQARAAAALTNSNEMILFFSEDGTIEWASPACTRLLGVQPHEIVGLNGIDLIHPEDQESAVLAFLSIPNLGDHVTTDFRVIDAEGRIRWIEEIATNLLDDPRVGSVVGNLRDVTERVDLLGRIDMDRRRLADAQAAARLGSFEIDLLTGDIARSDELCRILGLPTGSLSNASGLETIHPDDRHLLRSMLDQAVAGRNHGELEYRIVRPTGEVRWVRTSAVRLAEPNANVVAGTMLDITDRHDADEALEFQATHDWLTELPNPACIHASVQRALESAGQGTHVMVAVVGIDNFHQINDARGTAVGDSVLRAFAMRLRAQAEASDLIGRIRGDEFIVARTTSAAPTTAPEFGQRLKDVLGTQLSIGNDDDDDTRFRLSFSVGVATSNSADSPESLLADADAAMHEAKHDGGDRVVVFSNDARARSTRRRNIAAALPHALDHDEFRLVYQPVVDLVSLSTVGFEALLRWTHPDLGPIGPDEFIPIAEENRLIGPIGTWVIATALQQLADWKLDRRVPPELWMAINVSAQQLSQDHLPAHISEVLDRLGIAPGSVHLEITESVLMDRVNHALPTIAALHSLGLNINIDDFGTGYSSLSYLSRLSVDTIKVDRSFVGALAGDRDGMSIVRAIITLAKSLGLVTVAEGIETSQQRDTLRALGCTYGQGFLWSRPLDPGDAYRWMIDAGPSAAPGHLLRINGSAATTARRGQPTRAGGAR